MSENLPERRAVAVDLSGPMHDLDQAWRLASNLAQSDLVPVALRNKPANILLIMMTGAEIGLSVAMALRTLYVPSNGQPQMRGQLVLAKLRQAGHSYRYSYSDDGSVCTFTVVRDSGEEYQASFSIEDAVTAGLAKRDEDGRIIARSRDGKPLPWEQYREDLLFWRAVARAVNRGAPEVMLGFQIMGAAESDHGQQEVILQPQSPPQPVTTTPGAAAAGDPAPAPAQDHQGPEPASQADVIAELGEIDQQARRQFIDAAEQHLAQSSPREPDVEEAVEVAVVEEASSQPAKRAQLTQLAAKFRDLGWDPKHHGPSVLDACSAFAGRRVGNSTQLSQAEAVSLTAELSGLLRRHGEEAGPVVLADKVAEWKEAAAARDN